jgi:hypothetical protein
MLDGFLDACRTEYEKGNQGALLQAIKVCFEEKYPIPNWVSESFLVAYELVRMGDKESWDEVFGTMRPRKIRPQAFRLRQKRQMDLYNFTYIYLHQNRKTAIDRGLFEMVGKEFDVCSRVAEDDYYRVVNLLKSIGLEGNPKKILRKSQPK